MSTLSVRVSNIQPAAMSALEATSLKIRGISTLENVRRNLFGTVDREESRRFVERELTRQLDNDSRRWGFDFANERPLPGVQRFAWQLVPANAVPTALRRAPISVPAVKPTSQNINKTPSPDAKKVQKRITDFLKPRKRLATPVAVKKSPSSYQKQEHCATHVRPPKIARLTNFKRS